MAIAEDKLREWIAANEHNLTATALLEAIPQLQEERPFADMELNELFAEVDKTLDSMDASIEKIRDIGKAQAEIDAIANATLEKYPLL